MRAILERAIVHLLNEEQDKAEALFHKFMVERARQIHESLRQGDEVALSEGWDDEITNEEYFSETDLDDAEDGAEIEGAADDLADDLGDEGDVEGDEFEGDLDADVDTDVEDDIDAEEGDVDSRLDDIEDHIEKLTAEFEEMMAKVDGEGDDFADEDGEFDGETEDFGGEGDDFADEDGELGAEDDDDFADRIGDDLSDEVPGEEEEVEEGVFESKKGVNPFAKKGDKKADKKVDKADGKKGGKPKKGVNPFAEAAEEHEDDLEDITESVMAELEKVLVSLADGKEVGAAGKTVANKNDKSPLPNVKPDQRQGGKPVTIKSTNHSGFERETPPSSKEGGNGIPKARNVKKNGKVLSNVPAGGDKSALLHKDFAGGTKPTKSPVDGK